MCDVLTEMRNLGDKLNAATVNNYKQIMPFLIEEVQSMGNRMESALADNNDIRHYIKVISKLKKEIKKLEQKKEDLNNDE